VPEEGELTDNSGDATNCKCKAICTNSAIMTNCQWKISFRLTSSGTNCDDSRGHPASYSVGTVSSFTCKKRPAPQSCDLPLSTAGVRNEWG
jgi:hypothetical protein